VSATKYTFNLDGQLTRVLRPDSLAIDVAYDTAGRPSRLTLPNGQLQFTYSPTSGNLTGLTVPDGGTLSYTYDGVLPKTVTWGGVVQGSVGFAYDSSFRVSKIAVNGADSITFGYDRDNLLTSAGAMTLLRDPQSGRLVRTVLGSDTSTWIYDDSTGNVLRYSSKHGATTVFDAAYTRDSLGRVTQTIETRQGATSTKSFSYDSVGRLNEVRLDGAVVATYVYDANGNRTSLTTPPQAVTGIYDDLGSVRFVTDVATGEVVQRLDYDEFGRVTQNTNPGFQPFGFAGGLLDETTGLLRLGARDYDPAVGRWMTKDPLGLAGGVTNLYEYALNDPINNVDPLGLQAWYSRVLIGKARQGAMRAGEMIRGPEVKSTLWQFDPFIERAARRYNVQACLIRSIVFEEQTHQLPFEGLAEGFGVGHTVGRGQVTIGYYGRSQGQLLNPYLNILSIAQLLSEIQDAPLIDASRPEASGKCKAISSYGERVENNALGQFAAPPWPFSR
jgi:RHS repeat-associated protein